MTHKVIDISGREGEIKVSVKITHTLWSFTYASINDIKLAGSTPTATKPDANPTDPNPKPVGMASDLRNMYNNLDCLFFKRETDKLKYKILVEWFNDSIPGQSNPFDKFEFSYDEDNVEQKDFPNPSDPPFKFKFI
jgi:hypothetical protein